MPYNSPGVTVWPLILKTAQLVARMKRGGIRGAVGVPKISPDSIAFHPGTFYKGTSKNPEFAQMPHKGTPIRYGQKQPVRNRQQGAEAG